MLPKILSQDSNYDEWCEQEILNAYKDAAEYDQFMFGDFDYTEVWLNDKGNDIA
jgi:hypothetical protein